MIGVVSMSSRGRDIRGLTDLRLVACGAGKSVEEWLPIRILLQSLCNRAANRWNMCGADSANDPCHDLCPPCLQLRLERFNRHSSLLRTYILNVETKNSGEFRQVVDVAGRG